MTLAHDANAPVHFKDRVYQPLTMQDIAALTEQIPADQLKQDLHVFVGITETLRFVRSAWGLPLLMALVAEKSDTPTDDLAPFEQLQLAGLLTDRFYGFNPVLAEVEAGDNTGPPETDGPLPAAPASSPTGPA